MEHQCWAYFSVIDKIRPTSVIQRTHSENRESKRVGLTIVQTKTAGPLKKGLNIRATSMCLPAVDKTSCCGIWDSAELKEVISLVTVEVPTETCKQISYIMTKNT